MDLHGEVVLSIGRHNFEEKNPPMVDDDDDDDATNCDGSDINGHS